IVYSSPSTPHIFSFTDPSTTQIYTLSLHDALPIYRTSTWNNDEGEYWAFVHLFDPDTGREIPMGQVAIAGVGRSYHLAHWDLPTDRKSTRLNSSHSQISYAVFCLKKKIKKKIS